MQTVIHMSNIREPIANPSIGPTLHMLCALFPVATTQANQWFDYFTCRYA